jgi:O-acetylserine/cysteine efflux transporter
LEAAFWQPLVISGKWRFEGPARILGALTSMSWLSAGAVVYLALLSTHFGYGAWNHLIVKHGAARVAPFSMLVPIFGLTSGALVLGEDFNAYHALAALLVLLGVAVHAFGWHWLYRRRVAPL